MKLTTNQILAIILATLGVIMASTAQLTDLFGPPLTKVIQSVAGLLNGVLGATLAVLTGTSAQIKAVNDMPGVDRIVVNRDAGSSLAQAAVDPRSKVEASPEDQMAVNTTARNS